MAKDDIQKVAFEENTTDLNEEKLETEDTKKITDESLIKTPQQEHPMLNGMKMTMIAAIVVALGIASGFGLSRFGSGQSNASDTKISDNEPVTAITDLEADAIEKGKLYGSDDEEKFPDSSEGVLMIGGLDGEGTHRLLREGGPTQTIYMISSVMDLDVFEGARVTVWGETFSAQKASWLMDVGGVKVQDLNAEAPFEEELDEEEAELEE